MTAEPRRCPKCGGEMLQNGWGCADCGSQPLKCGACGFEMGTVPFAGLDDCGHEEKVR